MKRNRDIVKLAVAVAVVAVVAVTVDYTLTEAKRRLNMLRFWI